MNPTYFESLETIRAKERSWGDTNQAPAARQALEALTVAARVKLGYEVDPEYLRFLSVSDGLDFNGFVVYASHIVAIPGYSDRFIGGFVETNLQYWDAAANQSFIAFGETGDERYVFDVRSETFAELDHPSLEVTKEFTSFDQMLAYMLNRALSV